VSKSKFSLFAGKARVEMPTKEDVARETARPERGGPVHDGCTMRRTGRDVNFATIVTPGQAVDCLGEGPRPGKPFSQILDEMRAAYEAAKGGVANEPLSAKTPLVRLLMARTGR
jgi:hypothetical protein